MNGLIAVRVTPIQHVEHDNFAPGCVQREPNAPFTNPQTVFAYERLDGIDVTSAGLAELLDAIENQSALLDRNALALFGRGTCPNVTPDGHCSSSQSLRSSSCVYVGSPARNDALAASTAARSSSVSGSSVSGAFARASNTGSSFSARDIAEVWLHCSTLPSLATSGPDLAGKVGFR
jgi:hypothetical protein